MSRLVRQVLAAPVDMSQLAAADGLVHDGVGGLLLFGAAPPADLGQQLAALRATAPSHIAPLVMTDEEGGAIQRLAALVGPVPSARHMAQTMTAQQITTLARRIGTRLSAAGVTMDLAPVLDLDDGDGPNAVDADGTRSFSLDSSITAADGLAFARGLQTGHVIPVVKHFPGLGSATGNTDDGPASTLPWQLLRSSGLLPFKAAIDAGMPAIMVSNATVPGLSSTPASVSRTVVTGLLRHRLGFEGLVMTDSLSAHALSDAGYPLGRAVVEALRAGDDLILFGSSQQLGPGLTTTRIRGDHDRS